jgi:hypothetical protein
MELNNVTFSDFVSLVTIHWEKTKQSLAQEALNSGLFYREDMPQNTGNTRQYSEVDINEYARFKGEGAQSQRAKVAQGYTKILTSYRVSDDIGITYEDRTQNKYPEVVRKLTQISSQGYNRRELDLTHRVTFGTATTYTDMDGRPIDVTTGDGLALFSTAHTLKGTSATYRNRLANNPQFSRGSIEAMEAQIVANTLNQFGEKVTIPFDILFTSDDPNTINTVREYLKSTASVDAGANQGVINVYKGKYRHVVLPRLATDAFGQPDSTKTKYWGLASSLYTTGHLGVWEEPRMKIAADLNAGEEFSTDDWNFAVRAGYGICVVNGVWITLSTGDATP